jgi:polar amino acid transport system permease protein
MKGSRAGVFVVLSFLGLALGLLLLGKGLRFAPEPIGSRADLFLEGARASLLLTLVAGVAGLGLGMALALGRISALPPVRWLCFGVIELLRGTPLLVQILFIYYALPILAPFLKLDEFSAAAIGLALNVGAYNAEVIRAGIEALPRGQTEAALSLGLSRLQTLRYIILPQALRIVTPPLINNAVALLKDSSLASSIGLLEVTLAGQRISSETFMPVPVLTTVALLYLVMTTALTLISARLERFLSPQGARGAR